LAAHCATLMKTGMPRQKTSGAVAELRPRRRGHGSRHSCGELPNVSSPTTDSKDLVVPADRLLHLQGDLCPARCVFHAPMLDLKRFHRLGEFGSPTNDLHPITEAEIPVGELNHSDAHAVEVIGHDSDLLLHNTLSSEPRPRRAPAGHPNAKRA